MLRDEALDALRGSAAIIHAGDVGEKEILSRLEEIAPVTAVRGNVDRGELAHELPATAILEIEGARIWVLHNLAELDLEPKVAGIDVVVSGHTHAPMIREEEGVLYLNPGSAGPRRFHLPIAIAKLTVGDGSPRATIVEITP